MSASKLRSGGFFAQALRLALPCFAACAAAVLAHVAIDVAGDYVLARDAYDTLDHGSRWTVSLLALAAAGGGLWAVLRAALAEARGSHDALRTVLRAATPASALRSHLLTLVLTVPILLAMAGLDVAAAGKPVDDLGDLLGGSYLLAAVLIASSAWLVSFGTGALLRWLCRHSAALLRAVEAFVRLAFAFDANPLPRVSPRELSRPRTHSALRRCTSGNRAPPALLA